MKLNIIKEKFISYFESKNHKLVPYSSLIPKKDNSIMFTNSGMVQFKKIFLGLEKTKNKRIISIQPCVRLGGKHNDINSINNSNIHHTFFEMLGCWSFGDYFKKEAIEFIWELLTKIYNIPTEKLLVTVYKLDKETYKIWLNNIKINKNQILIIGDKNIKYNSDNFWQMEETGPCGPSTEIFYDKGVNFNNKDRYIEILNCVFIQYNRSFDKYNKLKLSKLSKVYIDIGIGLERLASILQNTYNNYNIDLFMKIKKGVLLEINSLNINHKFIKIISDYIRSIVFLVLDGVKPNNYKTGYVLKYLIRKAYVLGYICNKKTPFLYKISNIVIQEMSNDYPNLIIKSNYIKNIIKNEEKKFILTINKNLIILFKKINNIFKFLSGKTIYKLYNTYGLPFELIFNFCEKYNIYINKKEFYYYLNNF